jgi:very-short-patch-repair endonuclease/uncharacterized C2H2 Zn-finger protein
MTDSKKGIFTCLKCSKGFRHRKTFDSHIQSSSCGDGSGVLHCNSCGKDFTYQKVFANHKCKGPPITREQYNQKLSEGALRRWAKKEERDKQSLRTENAWQDPVKGEHLRTSTLAHIHFLFAGRNASWWDDRREMRLEAHQRGVSTFFGDKSRPEYKEYIQKQSELGKQRWAEMSDEDYMAYSKLMSDIAIQNYENRPELRLRISRTVSIKQRARSEEISEHSTNSWANPEQRMNRLNGMAEFFRSSEVFTSGLEKKIQARLIELGVPIDPKTNVQQVMLGSFISDFVWHEEKVVLEVQGCRWHCCEHPNCLKYWTDFDKHEVATIRGNDSRKRTRLTNEGWTVVYLWEHDVMRMLEEIRDEKLSKLGFLQ